MLVEYGRQFFVVILSQIFIQLFRNAHRCLAYICYVPVFTSIFYLSYAVDNIFNSLVNVRVNLIYHVVIIDAYSILKGECRTCDLMEFTGFSTVLVFIIYYLLYIIQLNATHPFPSKFISTFLIRLSPLCCFLPPSVSNSIFSPSLLHHFLSSSFSFSFVSLSLFLSLVAHT